jgi:uncharacterized protein (UPF0333 family)
MNYSKQGLISVNSAISSLLILLVVVIVGIVFAIGSCNSACLEPPSVKGLAEKAKGINIFIDNSASMAPIIYSNTQMKDQLFNNVITGLDPLASDWGADIKFYLVAEKVRDISLDSLKKVIGSMAAVERQFNGQGTPLDKHFESAFSATAKDEIGILVTDGIICATTEDIKTFQKETGRETFTKENLANFAALVKKQISDRYKSSDDFVFRVFHGKTKVEFGPRMPYYNYKNVPLTDLSYNFFPYYYFVWGPTSAVEKMVETLNQTSGFLGDLTEVPMKIARIKGNAIEPVFKCRDLDFCGAMEWSQDSTVNILNISKVDGENIAFFIKSDFIKRSGKEFETGPYYFECEIRDAQGKQVFSFPEIAWSNFQSTSEQRKMEKLVEYSNSCTKEQINRNDFLFSLTIEPKDVDKLKNDDMYTFVLKVKAAKPAGLTDYLAALSTDDDEKGPGEGKTFGIAQLLHAISEVPSFTDWTLMEYTFNFKYEQ